MKKFDVEYWNNLYKEQRIGWDIGYAAPALTEYIDQIKNKHIKILVPGAGNAYEVEYLHKKNFKNVFMLDFSVDAVNSFKKRYSDFPDENIITDNFFSHKSKYDLILEQTFFTSFCPDKRKAFAKKIFNLLNKGGKYVGLFFSHEFMKPIPPFGATKEIYEQLFLPFFNFKRFEIAYNSIKPRKGREYFFIMQKKIKR